jgi:hypothetical protein
MLGTRHRPDVLVRFPDGFHLLMKLACRDAPARFAAAQDAPSAMGTGAQRRRTAPAGTAAGPCSRRRDGPCGRPPAAHAQTRDGPHGRSRRNEMLLTQNTRVDARAQRAPARTSAALMKRGSPSAQSMGAGPPDRNQRWVRTAYCRREKWETSMIVLR